MPSPGAVIVTSEVTETELLLGNSSLPIGDASEKRSDKYHAKAEAYIRHMRNLAACNRETSGISFWRMNGFQIGKKLHLQTN